MTTVMQGKVEAKRNQGRPPASYIDNVKADSGLQLYEVIQMSNLSLPFIFFIRLESFLSRTFLPVSKTRTNRLCILRQCKYIKHYVIYQSMDYGLIIANLI
jgi:hypothetical protein